FGGELLSVNFGPHHPSTHGVLRLIVDLDGEQVRSVKPVIGYLHTGIEKQMEALRWQQGVVVTDRHDYLSPPINNLAYALAVERLMGVEAPPRAQALRVIMSELTRLSSHLVWLGTSGLELGAMSMLMYCFRERETILDMNEEISGFRMHTSYIRPGGVMADATPRFLDMLASFVKEMPGHVAEYDDRKMLPPPREELETSMEAVIHHFKLFTEGYSVPAGDVYVAVESGRGENGCYIVSDGMHKPRRVKFRSASFVNLQALERMALNHMIADMIA